MSNLERHPCLPTVKAVADGLGERGDHFDPDSATPGMPTSSSSFTPAPAGSSSMLVSSPDMKLLPQPFSLPEAPAKSSSLGLWSFMGACSSRANLTFKEKEMEAAETLQRALDTALQHCNYNYKNGRTEQQLYAPLSETNSLEARCKAIKELLNELWEQAESQTEEYRPYFTEQKKFCLNFLAILSAQEVNESNFASLLEDFEKRTQSSQATASITTRPTPSPFSSSGT